MIRFNSSFLSFLLELILTSPKSKILCLGSCLLFGLKTNTGFSQDLPNTRIYTLQEVVKLAREQSPSFRYASVLFDNKRWQYRNYRSNFLPQLTLNGTFPEYKNTITPVLQNNGSVQPVRTHNANSTLQLSLGQEIWFTGAQISINSRINRFDDFIKEKDPNLPPRIPTRYTSIPATFTLNQPLFNFNYRAWERKTAPMRFEEAKREYWEEMEEISVAATDNFFNLLLNQISYQIARKNVANSDTLYKIGQERFALGKIAENELLQMELTSLNARQNLEQTTLDVEGSTLRLKVYLGLTDDDPIRLIPPYEIPQFEVEEKIALREAHKNRQRIIGFERELIEAYQRMAQAKGETGINANLYASFGLTQQAKDFSEAYRDPSEQQIFSLGFNIPVMDWGRSASRLGTAKANQELVKANIEQQKINFDQDIYLNVKRFKVLRSQMTVAKRTDEIAEKRYVITKDRYLNGQIGILELNVATEERDKATRSYISALRSFWSAYYNLRRLTLFDFELNQPLLSDL